MKKLMLLINPNAGKGGYKTSIGEVLDIFSSGGYLTTVFFTRGRGDAPRLIAENAADYDMAVCIGGDGTLSGVTGGMMRIPEERRPLLGYIPLGTANDVSRSLGISRVPATAARRIVEGTPRPYDVGYFCNDKHFSYIAAFGAFTEVSYATPQDLKKNLGHLAYLLEGIRSLSKIRAYEARVEYDEGVIEGEIIFGSIQNSTSMGGIVRLDSQKIDLADGLSEIILIPKVKDILQLNDILADVTMGDFSGDGIIFLKTTKAKLTFKEEVAWTIDGEDAGLHSEVTIENCHPGVNIMV